MTAKLLFDQNLSPRLVSLLIDLFPGSSHVSTLGMGDASDQVVWNYAALEGFIIVTKDADFNDFTVALGFPPKVVWIRRGNCSTKTLEGLLRANYLAIENLSTDSNIGLLTLF